MFRFFSFRNSILTSTLISFGKAFTIVLLVCLLINPSAVNLMPQTWKTTIGILSLTFATLGLFSCFYSFSRVMLSAAFWVIAIYFLSSTFLQVGSISVPYYSAKAIPKILPGGLFYDEIPDTNDRIVNAGYNLPSSKGLMDKIYSYVSMPIEQAGNTFNISTLGLKSASFNDMTFNSGVLPDSAYFANSSKRNFYPIKDRSQDSTLGLNSILKMLPAPQ